MSLKQKIKLVNLIFAIIATLSLLLPLVNDSKSNYNTIFHLMGQNGFRVGILFTFLAVIATVATSFLTIYFDDNKIIPVLLVISSLTALILSFFIKQLSTPDGDITWSTFAKLGFGAYILIVALGISFVASSILAIRVLILKKDDEEYEEVEEENEEEFITDNSTTNEINNDYILDEFKNE